MAYPFLRKIGVFINARIRRLHSPSPRFSYSSALEPGLKLYEEEGLTGVEYPVGGRYIDILAVDAEGNFVVIELKVSKGYDRVIGQLLRYMSWIEKNLADGNKVRGWIIAREISDDLKLATARVSDVSLFEYEISFAINATS